MAKRNKDPLARIQLKRPMCSYPDCKNKGRRIAARQYSNRCAEHKQTYGAA